MEKQDIEILKILMNKAKERELGVSSIIYYYALKHAIEELEGEEKQIVHCIDCDWRGTKACFCKAPNDVQDDWFCSEGEKRE